MKKPNNDRSRFTRPDDVMPLDDGLPGASAAELFAQVGALPSGGGMPAKFLHMDPTKFTPENMKEISEGLMPLSFLHGNMRQRMKVLSDALVGQTEDPVPMLHIHALDGTTMDNIVLDIAHCETHEERVGASMSAGIAIGMTGIDIDYILMEMLGWQVKRSREKHEEMGGGGIKEHEDKQEMLLLTGTTLDGRQAVISMEVYRIGCDSADDTGQGPVTSMGEPEFTQEVESALMKAVVRGYLMARLAKIGEEMSEEVLDKHPKIKASIQRATAHMRELSDVIAKALQKFNESLEREKNRQEEKEAGDV